MEKNQVILFLKYPTPGKVKTRLAKSIGDEKAAGYYKSFVETLIKSLEDAGLPFSLFYSPVEKLEAFKSWLGDHHPYITQPEGDLGNRLKAGFEHCFENGYERVLAIGSDTPDLPVSYLEDGFNSLETNEAVIGPTKDGGYYVIGFTKSGYDSGAFEDISWSTEVVFNQTVDHFRRSNIKFSQLSQWHDIDSIHDLERYLSPISVIPA